MKPVVSPSGPREAPSCVLPPRGLTPTPPGAAESRPGASGSRRRVLCHLQRWGRNFHVSVSCHAKGVQGQAVRGPENPALRQRWARTTVSGRLLVPKDTGPHVTGPTRHQPDASWPGGRGAQRTPWGPGSGSVWRERPTATRQPVPWPKQGRGRRLHSGPVCAGRLGPSGSPAPSQGPGVSPSAPRFA